MGCKLRSWPLPVSARVVHSTRECVSDGRPGYVTVFPLVQVSCLKILSYSVAPLDDTVTEPPVECIHTDGCGWMNNAALSAIAGHMGQHPTAVHGRFAGAKGLWVLHPHDKSPTPKIWIRDSQVKSKLAVENLYPAHSIFELLGLSRVTPTRLSRSVILNLAHNGVPKETFVQLMKDMIDEEVKPLMQWTGPKTMLLLSKVVEGLGTGRGWMNYELHDQSPGATEQPRRTIHDVILDLLQAGFHPLKLEYLFESLKKCARLSMDNIVCDFHLPVPRSARAFIVPGKPVPAATFTT